MKRTSFALSILLVLFASNAWAEVKTLECEYTNTNKPENNNNNKETYTFDPEMPNGETTYQDKILPVEVTAFPNFYRLTYEQTLYENYMINLNEVDISRVDLSVTKKIKKYSGGDLDYERNVSGQCKFIESAKKLF